MSTNRPYDSRRRRQQAERTRLDVLEAARALFLERGYRATTFAAIADRAGVSVDTVYSAYRNKPGLFRALATSALRGGENGVPVARSEAVAQIRAEPDARRKLQLYGTLIAELNPRFAPLARLLREAAPAEPELAAMWERLKRDRLSGMSAFAAHLDEEGLLRPGVSRAHARDVLWTLNSPDLYDLLVGERGWSAKRYGTWVAEQMAAALLTQ